MGWRSLIYIKVFSKSVRILVTLGNLARFWSFERVWSQNQNKMPNVLSRHWIQNTEQWLQQEDKSLKWISNKMRRALNTNVWSYQGRDVPSTQGQWETVSKMNSIVDTTHLLISPRTLAGEWGGRAPFWSSKGHQNVELNRSTNKLLYLFFKHKLVYLVSVENCNSGLQSWWASIHATTGQEGKLYFY